MVQLGRLSPLWFGIQLSSHLPPPAHISQTSPVHALFLGVPQCRSPPHPSSLLSSPEHSVSHRKAFMTQLQRQIHEAVLTQTPYYKREGGLQQSRRTRW